MKKLAIFILLAALFTACSDDDDDKKYCWDEIYVESEYPPCVSIEDGYILGLVCDLTEREMKALIEKSNQERIKLYESGQIDCIHITRYEKSEYQK